MKVSQLAMAIFVATLILFATTLYGLNTHQKERAQVYIDPKHPVRIHVIDYSGELMVDILIMGEQENASSINNISVYLDGKKIDTDRWISTGYIGIHTIIIKSTKKLALDVLVLHKGRTLRIPLSFGIITALSGAITVIDIMRERKRKVKK